MNTKIQFQSAPVPPADPTQIQAVADLVLKSRVGCIELRTIGNKSGRTYQERLTEVGFYNDVEPFVRDALANHGKKQVYFGLNPRIPELLHAQPANALSPGEGGKTKDVLFRTFFGIDIDTKRPSSRIAATDEELAMATSVFEEIKAELTAKAIPFITGMSGNGRHINILTNPYPVSLESESKSGPFALLLRSLQRRFGNAAAEVDISTFDAPRVWKLYGTAAVKGGNTIERPWRTAYLEIPESWPQPVDLLEAYKKEIEEQRKLEHCKAVPRFGARDSKIDLVELFKGEKCLTM